MKKDTSRFLKRHVLTKAFKRYFILAFALWVTVSLFAVITSNVFLNSLSDYYIANPDIYREYREVQEVYIAPDGGNSEPKEFYVVTEKDTISVDIPDYAILDINTFRGCMQLIRIDFPAATKEINPDWFNKPDLPKLAEINVHPSNKHYSTKNGILYNKDKTKLIFFPWSHELYEGSNRETEYTLPSSVKVIGKGAFRDNSFLEAIIFNSTLKTIEERAFYNCKKLEDITLPSSLEKVDKGAFAECKNIESVQISINSKFTEIAESAFMKCESLKVINIPNNVKNIGKWAFSGCSFLQVISLPSGIEVIDDFAFANCTRLGNLYISSTIQYIGRGAFQHSSAQLSFQQSKPSENWDKNWKHQLNNEPQWGVNFP